MGRILILFLFLLIAGGGYSQSPLKLRDTTNKGPQTFAMIVGISNYKYIRPLTYADKDAEMFRDYLRSPGGGRVKEENIFCLLNEQAINQNFWGKGFQWLKAKRLQRGDKLFIYLAGHGDAIDEDQFFFLGYDCNPGGDKNNYLVSGAIQLFNLKKKIANETSKGVEVIFIMDACRSHELPGGTAGQNFLNSAISEKKAGEIIMLATGAGQESLEHASIGTGHGLFTYYLVDGLNGMADSLETPDQKISFREIQTYVNRNVPSIAQQRFNRKQDPYFCCNENSEKIISAVDTNYLRNWLRTKKAQDRGPGNSFTGLRREHVFLNDADTLLQETYNRFNRAIRNNDLSGPNSAEEYYRQLDKKFPGDPYTLDAMSTLSVLYVTMAQKLVDDYIVCGGTSRQKQQMGVAGTRLEKAIGLLRSIDQDFANSLLNRMYLLKASGDETLPTLFQHAYSALAIDPGGAYILNKLALLHLENKQADSALYYANKAVVMAPNWPCAVSTLGLIRNSISNPAISDTTKRPKKRNRHFGHQLSYGMSKPMVSYSKDNWRQGNSIYTDSLENITTKAGSRFDIGFNYYKKLGGIISIRPAIVLGFEGGQIIYHRKETAGVPAFADVVETERSSVNLSLPVLVSISKKIPAFYFSLSPVVSFDISTEKEIKLPAKKLDYAGEAAFGGDIPLKKAGIILSPELKYVYGLNNLKATGNNIYSNTISSVKRRALLFSVYIRPAL